MRILITAGGTREYIDPVRFISNASSGRMGYALASAALKAGNEVTLITTVNRAVIGKQLPRIVNVETAAEMFEAVKKHFDKCDCLIMAAAVADYTAAKTLKLKLKKEKKDLTIKLKPTADILKWAGKNKNAKGKKRIVVGFALEDKILQQNAEKKLIEKNLDMIVANSVSAIGNEKSAVHIKVSTQSWRELPPARKDVTARRIIKLIEVFDF
ncbi:phosphopantothenoylcysteine decarboxylase [Planctomycetota bacterium]